MARNIRIGLMLFVFALVAINAWQTKARTTDWGESLWVAIYPINGDNSEATAEYIRSLDADDFTPVAEFVDYESKKYEVVLTDPAIVNLAPEVTALPPALPEGGKVLSVVWWSLKLRYWARTNNTFKGPTPDVRIFVVYFDPATHKQLEQSAGLKEGLIGVVNAFANRKFAARNNVIVLHEMLHTLGATDKYNLNNGQPIFPEGYAAPEANPRYPQRRAEIMGAAVPVSETEAKMPTSVWQTMVGGKTATEIGWLQPG